jgi:hypothetical protein
MADIESDNDENEDYNEEDNEEEENNQNNQNQEQNNKIKEFNGVIGNKPGWTNCVYCDKSHPPSMHLPGMLYCIHCWAWFNSTQLDLEKGTYSGLNTISDVKKYLKDTFKLHDPIKCTTSDCIYNKIINFEKNKKLHNDFCVELGFIVVKEVKQKISNESNSSGFKINLKSNLRINYKLSHITI